MQQLKSLAHEYLMTSSYILRDIIMIDKFMTRNIHCGTLLLLIILLFSCTLTFYLFVSMFQVTILDIKFLHTIEINDFSSIHLKFPTNSNTIHYVHGIIQERDKI